jgi:hypothetical protein
MFLWFLSSRIEEEEEDVWMGTKEVDFRFEKSPRRPFTNGYSIRIHILKLKLFFCLQLSSLCKIHHEVDLPSIFWFSSYRPFTEEILFICRFVIKIVCAENFDDHPLKAERFLN